MLYTECQIEHQKQLINEFISTEFCVKIKRFYQDKNHVINKEDMYSILAHAASLWEGYCQDKRLGYNNTFWSAVSNCYEKYPEIFTLHGCIQIHSARKFLIFIDPQWDNIAEKVLFDLFDVHKKQAITLLNGINLIVYTAVEEYKDGNERNQRRVECCNLGQRIFAELQEKQGVRTTVLSLYIENEIFGHIDILSKGDALQLFKGNSRHTNSYIREDLKQLFRSSWEANIARFFNFNNIAWEYEPNSLLTSEVFYQPDFLCTQSVIVEVKGFWDNQSLQKVFEFHKRFPKYRIGFIDGDLYKAIDKDFGTKIEHWEFEQVSLKSVFVPVVGMTFVQDKTVFSEILLDDDVLLVREPFNAYDNNAIAVYSKSNKLLGHISKEWALILAQKIDFGMTFKAVISQINQKVIKLKIVRDTIKPTTIDNYINFFKRI